MNGMHSIVKIEKEEGSLEVIKDYIGGKINKRYINDRKEDEGNGVPISNRS
jgi:hypothetical protein